MDPKLFSSDPALPVISDSDPALGTDLDLSCFQITYLTPLHLFVQKVSRPQKIKTYQLRNYLHENLYILFQFLKKVFILDPGLNADPDQKFINE